MPATPETRPAPFNFAAALTPAQIEGAASTVDSAAVTSRALLACMKLDSVEMIAAWRSEPDAFMELFESAPAAIEKAKVVLEVLEKSYHRLMLTGEFAMNEGDEAEHEISIPLSDDEFEQLQSLGQENGLTPDEMLSALLKDWLAVYAESGIRPAQVARN